MKYSKQEIINSNKYGQYAFWLASVLKDGKEYTEAEINTVIKKIMRKKVD